MKIDIRSAGQRLTGLLLEHVVQRVRDLLAHRRHRIRNVSVRLMDLGGANGGPDQRCVVQVKLHRLPAVVAEETQADARVAIDRALSRVGRAVSRRLESAHAGSQNVPPRPQARSSLLSQPRTGHTARGTSDPGGAQGRRPT